MNEQELVSEIKALEHRLTELWGWTELGRIGWNLNVLHLAWEPDNADMLEAHRGLEQELETHLATCYNRALAEVDSTLPRLSHTPILTALLQRLQHAIQTIGEHSFAYYLDRSWHPEEDHFEYEGSGRTQAQAEEAARNHNVFVRDAWHCVERALGYYLNKTAEHIATYIGAHHTAKTPPSERIKWTCTTAVYVHLVTELLGKGYIELPGKGGKTGDGNVTELFRRLSQAFIVMGAKGAELVPDELQRRYNGRPLAPDKARRLSLPEAREL